MKMLTVVGARPQFIKAAVVSRIVPKSIKEVFVHTGQHYDYNMSDIFFDELNIKKPDYNLGIAGGNHGHMTGKMIIKIEEVLLQEQPDTVLVYGDTNSTLAAALAAVKLQIPVCHVESGARLGTLSNPEEINRICTDHVSSILLYCTRSAENHLMNEGLYNRALFVGDPMYDAFLYYGNHLTGAELECLFGINGNNIQLPSEYYYLTCHRQENTDSDDKLTEILNAMNSLDAKTIFPVHPRIIERVQRICYANGYENVLLTQPVGYLTSISLVKNAKKIVTDSGGLQREAFFAGKQCVTVFDYVCWPETMVGNRNQLAKPDAEEILKKIAASQTIVSGYNPFGDGNAGERIINAILTNS